MKLQMKILNKNILLTSLSNTSSKAVPFALRILYCAKSID
jgi:hypothetical protein